MHQTGDPTLSGGGTTTNPSSPPPPSTCGSSGSVGGGGGESILVPVVLDDLTFDNRQVLESRFSGRIATLASNSAACCYTRSSVVGRSVCLLVTFASPGKTAESIEMPFGLLTRVGPRNHVFEVCADPPGEGTILGGCLPRPIEKDWAPLRLSVTFGGLSPLSSPLAESPKVRHISTFGLFDLLT